jgi:serine/threonine protein kinase
MATRDGARAQQSPQDTKLILTPPPPKAIAVATASPGAPTATVEKKSSGWKGRRVKRFRLIDELGEGAMGRVFVAEDTILKRNVALKLLPAKHRDGRPNHRTEKLVSEARSAANLEHPNVVTIYEIDQISGVHYIAMELVEGGNLERLVQMSGPMEVERACQLVADAAEALSHAHARGIIHRDIKPANLLLSRSGRCKLCDFGLAAIDSPEDPQRMKCVGTPNFISPEVARGKGATAASDIYSLGCTLWFLLTGRPPYSGSSSRDVLKLHVNEPLPDLRKWRPDVPEKLIAVINQACSKDPKTRFDDAEQFAKMLRTFTIPLAVVGAGSKGGVTPVSSGPAMSGYVLMSESGIMQPVNALSAVPIQSLSAPASSSPALSNDGQNLSMAPAEPRLKIIPTPFVWAGCGTAAAAICIALGVWIARSGPQKAEASPSPAPSASIAVPSTPVAPPAPAPAIATSIAGENILPNANMDAADTDDGLANWFIHPRFKSQVQILSENGNRFVRLTNDDPEKTVFVDQKIPVDPAWKAVTVTARMRAINFHAGKLASQDGRVAFAFRDDADKRVGSWPPVPTVRADSPWVERVATVDVPAGAKTLYLQMAIFNATGTVDFDDVKVIPQAAK